MEHFIIIRFSVRFSNSPEFEAKKHLLFDEKRLDFRFELFEKFCFPTLTNQTLKDFKIIIIYDELLPEKYLNRLKEITQNESKIILHQWSLNDNLSSNQWLIKYMNYSNLNPDSYIITTRLDDDDMINLDLNYSLKRYLKKFNCINKIISFQGGNFLNYYSQNNIELVPIKYSSLAVFLSKIHQIKEPNIYYHVHHNHGLEQRIIKKPNAFVVINHSFENDNRLDRFSKKKGKKVSLEELLNLLKINESTL